MNKAEADSLLHSIDNATMETAKDLMKRLLPAMKGGKWDAMTQIQKVCVLVAIAIRYGERRARHETAGSGTQGN